MSGTKALLDSDAIIYATKQIIDTEKLLSEHEEHYASIVTFIEVYSYEFPNDEERQIADQIFNNIDIIPLDQLIAEQAIAYRTNPSKKIKLPDSVILATARILGADIITNNLTDFANVDPSVRLIDISAYRIEAT